MKNGFAKIMRVKRGILHFAEVSLLVDIDCEKALTTFTCKGKGFIGQGIL